MAAMDGLDSVLGYAEQQRRLLSKESDRLTALRRELATLLQIESEQLLFDDPGQFSKQPTTNFPELPTTPKRHAEPQQQTDHRATSTVEITQPKRLFPSLIDDANQQSSTNRQVQLANQANHDQQQQFAGPRLVPVRVNDLNAIENRLALDNEAQPLISKLGRYEEKRRQLNRERKHDYNEYLKQQAQLEGEKQKRRYWDNNANLRKSYLESYAKDDNYANLLNRKRQEERAYREVNGLGVIHELDDSTMSQVNHFTQTTSQPHSLPPITKTRDNDYDLQYMHEFSSLEHRPPATQAATQTHQPHHNKEIQTNNTAADTNLTSLNNPIGVKPTVTFAAEPSTLRHPPPFGTDNVVRLSPAEKRRQEQLRYREELKRQIEEKRRRAEDQRRREDYENRRIEARIEDQRRRMLEEYYDEEERQKRKTDELIKKQELVKQSTRPDSPMRNFRVIQSITADLGPPPTGAGAPVAGIRSPSYLHVKLSSSAKVPPLHRHTSSIRALDDRLRKTSISVAGGELEAVRKRLNSPSRKAHQKKLVLMPDGTVRPENPTPPKTQEGALHLTEQIERNNEVLGKLTEFRKKLQEDHLRMLNDLKPA